MSVCCVIVAAGAGTRVGLGMNKALLPLAGVPVFLHSVRRLQKLCDCLILVTREDERGAFEDALYVSDNTTIMFAGGGATRRDSVENALALAPRDAEIILVHDAARPFPPEDMVREVIRMAREKGAAAPAVPVADTLRREESGTSATVPREGLWRVQTPQGFRREILIKAYEQIPGALTDDAGLVEQSGVPVALVAGSAMNFKITDKEDYAMAQAIAGQQMRVGTGYDVHRLVPGRALVLCGLRIPFERGLLGHSDADVALHALMDALLGAAALGDIGRHFPDSDGAYLGISSLALLSKTRDILAQNGFLPLQADVTIVCQRPKLAPYMEQMRENVARALGVPLSHANVKATTTEGLGFEGEGEGISAQAMATVTRIWSVQG